MWVSNVSNCVEPLGFLDASIRTFSQFHGSSRCQEFLMGLSPDLAGLQMLSIGWSFRLELRWAVTANHRLKACATDWVKLTFNASGSGFRRRPGPFPRNARVSGL